MAEMEEGEEEDDRRGTPENDMGERSGMGPPQAAGEEEKGRGELLLNAQAGSRGGRVLRCCSRCCPRLNFQTHLFEFSAHVPPRSPAQCLLSRTE